MQRGTAEAEHPAKDSKFSGTNASSNSLASRAGVPLHSRAHLRTFFTHVRHTRIDFDATVSEITFTVDDQTRFSPPLALSPASIVGVTLDQQNAWKCPLSACR